MSWSPCRRVRKISCRSMAGLASRWKRTSGLLKEAGRSLTGSVEQEEAVTTAKFHVHFNSRSKAHRVFHMTDELCKAALARRRDLTGKVRITAGWDLVNSPEALKTAAMFVTSMQVPRENLRAMAPLLRCIHCIGARVDSLRP